MLSIFSTLTVVRFSSFLPLMMYSVIEILYVEILIWMLEGIADLFRRQKIEKGNGCKLEPRMWKELHAFGRNIVQVVRPKVTGHAKYIQRFVIALSAIGNSEKFDTHSSLLSLSFCGPSMGTSNVNFSFRTEDRCSRSFQRVEVVQTETLGNHPVLKLLMATLSVVGFITISLIVFRRRTE